MVAYHTQTEFTSPTTGFSRHRIYKITKTEPYSSYSIVATAKQDFVLFIPSVLFDGTVIYQRWDGLETSTREKVITNHIWDSSSGERNLEVALYPGINSPNSLRVFTGNAFQDVFGGGNRVVAVGLPTHIFAWFVAY
ncbi:MAG: hypothetical protein M3Y08_04430 [Fibrobacterota bacterium]|nr:hypothetical protein [Fibrobacterota bacterium]